MDDIPRTLITLNRMKKRMIAGAIRLWNRVEAAKPDLGSSGFGDTAVLLSIQTMVIFVDNCVFSVDNPAVPVHGTWRALWKNRVKFAVDLWIVCG